MIAINKSEICEKSSLPKDVFLGDSIIEIIGKRSVYIENYILINEITESRIIVKCKHYYIFVLGKQLNIEYYSNKACMKIVGDIDEISFNRSLH